GYGVRLGARLDATTVRAWCSLSVQPKSAPAVLRALEAMPEVEEVSAVSGPFDYLAFVRCTSHEQLDALLDRLGQLDGVHQTQTSIVLSRKIDRRSIG
ncbi:transcriptional regulator, AsnC family, partial [Acidovorax delafieldii 2AN]